MNTVAGVAVLRGHIERFFWTVDLQWARKLPGYTANNPQSRNDRKPGDEACITDDELQNLFTHFVAKYHATPHRGLSFRTPNAVWDEKSEGVDFDMSQMPSPRQLREACGFYTKATVGEAGIKFAGAIYRNDFIRDQRKARQADRIAKSGETIEIKVDPFDLGAISVVVNGELISVPSANPETKKVINSIKTFMKHRDWPIVIVLSGIPELLDKVNLDPQLRNLLTPYYLQPLDPLAEDGFDEIDTALCGFAEATGIGISALRNEEVFMRMCYGHGNMYGRVLRFLVDAFASLPVDQSELTVKFLADRYALKTGCIPGHNVFLRDDYHGCDVEALMAGM